MYNDEYWSKKHDEYFAASWSKRPTFFAEEVASLFPNKAKILELGAGVGMDSLWFASLGHDVILSEATEVAFKDIKARADQLGVKLTLLKLDVSKPLEFIDESFDVVYAQLVLHYFDDDTTHKIMAEIKRVLKPGGILACMVNSKDDPEYDPKQEDSNGFMVVKGLAKRYFDLSSFKKFTGGFETIIYDTKGRTPKDDKKDTAGMIRFVGRKLY